MGVAGDREAHTASVRADGAGHSLNGIAVFILPAHVGTVDLRRDDGLVLDGQRTAFAQQDGVAVVGGLGRSGQRTAAGHGDVDTAAEADAVVGAVGINFCILICCKDVLPLQYDLQIRGGQPVVVRPQLKQCMKGFQIRAVEGQRIGVQVIADAVGKCSL